MNAANVVVSRDLLAPICAAHFVATGISPKSGFLDRVEICSEQSEPVILSQTPSIDKRRINHSFILVFLLLHCTCTFKCLRLSIVDVYYISVNLH